MRGLNRNKRKLYYALYEGEIPNVDEYGNETGESTPSYGEPIELRCNVSSAMGEDVVQAFGNFTNYTRVICVGTANCPIDEDSIIWFGISPDEPHNYIVTRKADSINSTLYAIREVTVTA